jgi:hypothetical protein
MGVVSGCYSASFLLLWYSFLVVTVIVLVVTALVSGCYGDCFLVSMVIVSGC